MAVGVGACDDEAAAVGVPAAETEAEADCHDEPLAAGVPLALVVVDASGEGVPETEGPGLVV